MPKIKEIPTWPFGSEEKVFLAANYIHSPCTSYLSFSITVNAFNSKSYITISPPDKIIVVLPQITDETRACIMKMGCFGNNIIFIATCAPKMGMYVFYYIVHQKRN